MSQLQEVVRCYSCETFQVQIKKTTKKTKWTCKICNEKQSLKKVYFTGLGAECRKVVKEFNMKRGELAEVKNTLVLNVTEDIVNDSVEETETFGQLESSENISSQPSLSKWTSFLSPEEQQETERAFKPKSETFMEDITDNFDEDMEMNEDFVYTQNNRKRSKKDVNKQNRSKWQRYDEEHDNQMYADSRNGNQNSFNEFNTCYESKNKKDSIGVTRKSSSTSKWQTFNDANGFEQNNEVLDAENIYSDEPEHLEYNGNADKTNKLAVNTTVSSSSKWQKFGDDISNTCKPKSKWDTFNTSEEDPVTCNNTLQHEIPSNTKTKSNPKDVMNKSSFYNTISKTKASNFSTAPPHATTDFTKKFLLPRP